MHNTRIAKSLASLRKLGEVARINHADIDQRIGRMMAANVVAHCLNITIEKEKSYPITMTVVSTSELSRSGVQSDREFSPFFCEYEHPAHPQSLASPNNAGKRRAGELKGKATTRPLAIRTAQYVSQHPDSGVQSALRPAADRQDLAEHRLDDISG